MGGIFIVKDFNIIIKAILIGYAAINSLNNMDKPWVNVSIILSIIILSMLSYLLPKRLRRNIYFINIIFSAVVTIYINKIIIILFAFTLAEYLSIEKKVYYNCLFIIPTSILFTYKNNLCVELTSIIALSVYALIYGKKQEERLEFLEKEWDQNRRINSELSLKMKSREKFIEQEKISAKLQERNEISGAMHDKIGHTLAGALLQLEALGIILKKDGNEKAVGIINNVTNLLRNGMDDIRATLRSIKPPIEELGINKIKQLLQNKLKDTSFKYILTSEGNLDLISRRQWEIIIEGIRELSTNSLKYSKGNKIKVNIEVLNKYIKVEVIDDGIGSNKIIKGMGLQALEERLLNLQGNLILDGSRGFRAIMIFKEEGEL